MNQDIANASHCLQRERDVQIKPKGREAPPTTTKKMATKRRGDELERKKNSAQFLPPRCFCASNLLRRRSRTVGQGKPAWPSQLHSLTSILLWAKRQKNQSERREENIYSPELLTPSIFSHSLIHSFIHSFIQKQNEHQSSSTTVNLLHLNIPEPPQPSSP